MSNSIYSFSRGWGQVRRKDMEACRSKLMEVLGVKTLQGFRNRMKGLVEPKFSQKEAVDKVFAEYGITDVWGPMSKKD